MAEDYFFGGDVALQKPIFVHILNFLGKWDLLDSASLVSTRWADTVHSKDIDRWSTHAGEARPDDCRMSTSDKFMKLVHIYRHAAPENFLRMVARPKFERLAEVKLPSVDDEFLSQLSRIRGASITSFGDRSFQYSRVAYQRLSALFPNLKKVGFITSPETVPDILDYLRSGGMNLVHLKLIDSSVIDGGLLEKISRLCPNLEHFEYFGAPEVIARRGVRALVERCPNLRYLKIYQAGYQLTAQDKKFMKDHAGRIQI